MTLSRGDSNQHITFVITLFCSIFSLDIAAALCYN
jgi:hypothetical protein